MEDHPKKHQYIYVIGTSCVHVRNNVRNKKSIGTGSWILSLALRQVSTQPGLSKRRLEHTPNCRFPTSAWTDDDTAHALVERLLELEHLADLGLVYCQAKCIALHDVADSHFKVATSDVS